MLKYHVGLLKSPPNPIQSAKKLKTKKFRPDSIQPMAVTVANLWLPRSRYFATAVVMVKRHSRPVKTMWYKHEGLQHGCNQDRLWKNSVINVIHRDFTVYQLLWSATLSFYHATSEHVNVNEFARCRRRCLSIMCRGDLDL